MPNVKGNMYWNIGYVNEGQNQLKANLNEDIYQAKFIKNGWFRWGYLKLVELSATIFSFTLIYLASTRQLDNIDPLSYFRSTPRKHIFIIIAFLTAYCYLTDKFLSVDDFENEEGEEKELKDNSTPFQKMIVEFSADMIRIVDYFLVYYVVKEDVFAGTTNSHLIIIQWALLLMWFLFLTRKLIFWFCILILQGKDDTAWNIEKQIPDRMKDIEQMTQARMKELKKFSDLYKKYNNAKEKSNSEKKNQWLINFNTFKFQCRIYYHCILFEFSEESCFSSFLLMKVVNAQLMTKEIIKITRILIDSRGLIGSKLKIRSHSCLKKMTKRLKKFKKNQVNSNLLW